MAAEMVARGHPGWTGGMVAAVEAGKRNVDLGVLYALCDALGVGANGLLSLSPDLDRADRDAVPTARAVLFTDRPRRWRPGPVPRGRLGAGPAPPARATW